MKKIITLLNLVLLCIYAHAQESDTAVINKLFTGALNDKAAYENLRYLTKKIGGRVTGSPQAAAAVEWAKQVLENLHPDTVILQATKVPVWKRGEKEQCKIISPLMGSNSLAVCALGTSVGTGPDGIMGKVVEVKSFDELKKLGTKGVEGKIVFFNKIADQKYYYTFEAYDEVGFERVHGAAEAAKYGAAGVIVRSLTLADDNFPHTGVMRYENGVPEIPAIAVSTQGADLLSDWLKKDPQLNLYFRTTCTQDADGTSYNVIAELKGSEFPDQIITVGGHLDSWDLGEGANDDGAGVVQTIEILKLYKTFGIKPKHTIRFVMFMDEEINQSGAKKYAEEATIKKEKHYFAFESDRGSMTPLGFSIHSDSQTFNHILKFRKYFEPWGIYQYFTDGNGVDIDPLRKFDIPTIALVPDSQRYLYFHHSAADTFDKIFHRELQLGSAAMASLIWLLDKYGLK